MLRIKQRTSTIPYDRCWVWGFRYRASVFFLQMLRDCRARVRDDEGVKKAEYEITFFRLAGIGDEIAGSNLPSETYHITIG